MAVKNNFDIIWSLIRYFSPKEKWGDAKRMRPELLLLLDQFRSTFPKDSYIIVNCGYEKRKTGGGHPEGRAVDFHIHGLSFTESVDRLERFIQGQGLEGWVALGIYPEWGNWERSGFHLEIEKEERKTHRRWGAQYLRDHEQNLLLKNGQPHQEYISYAMALSNYQEHLLIG